MRRLTVPLLLSLFTGLCSTHDMTTPIGKIIGDVLEEFMDPDADGCASLQEMLDSLDNKYIKALDIEQAEVESMMTKKWTAEDTNEDGCVTKDEVKAYGDKMKEEGVQDNKMALVHKAQMKVIEDRVNEIIQGIFEHMKPGNEPGTVLLTWAP